MKNEVEPVSKTATAITATIMVGLFMGFIALLFSTCSGPTKPRTQEDIQFSAWDGSHIKTEAAIKATLNFPDSYKHIETRKCKSGKGFRVITVYSAKNAFGMAIRKTVDVIVDENGDIIKIL